MRRRIVIHNHLPTRDDIKSGAYYENNRHPMAVSRDEEERYRDAAYKKTGITRVTQKPGDPDFEKWKKEQTEEQNKRGGGFHNDGGPGSGPGGGGSKEQNAKEVKRLRQELSRVDINQPGALKKYNEISAKLEEAEKAPRTIKSYEWGKPR